MTLPSSFRAAMCLDEDSLVELSLKNGKAIYSEDLQHGGVLGGVLIVNPFLDTV